MTENKANNNNQNAKKTYTAEDIYVLEGLEPVRKRPGMYIGSTDSRGLHHLIWEVLDNSVDEAMAGYAKNIAITLLPNGRVQITDDGRGIPVEKHSKTKKSALETVMTTLHAGGKFGGESYKISGGLHGVGVSVVCALSKWMEVRVCRDGAEWSQEYLRGKAKSDVKKIGKCLGSGTSVVFDPDPEVFKEIKYDWKTILERCREQAYLTPGLRIIVFDKREKDSLLHASYAFYFEGGLVSFVEHLNHETKIVSENIFYVKKEEQGISVEVALQYIDELGSHEISFANNINTPDGGSHLTGFRGALTRVLNNYARKNGHLKEKDENLSGDDVREGLVA
ncbi:MAG: ATP-binding protein, partial [Candidatus Paceibacteria bacterium]